MFAFELAEALIKMVQSTSGVNGANLASLRIEDATIQSIIDSVAESESPMSDL